MRRIAIGALHACLLAAVIYAMVSIYAAPTRAAKIGCDQDFCDWLRACAADECANLGCGTGAVTQCGPAQWEIQCTGGPHCAHDLLIGHCS
jgi:hypothetical protein